MTGRILYQPGPSTKHECNPSQVQPPPPEGTIWKCDDCGLVWIIDHTSSDYGLMWRHETKREGRRRRRRATPRGDRNIVRKGGMQPPNPPPPPEAQRVELPWITMEAPKARPHPAPPPYNPDYDLIDHMESGRSWWRRRSTDDIERLAREKQREYQTLHRAIVAHKGRWSPAPPMPDPGDISGGGRHSPRAQAKHDLAFWRAHCREAQDEFGILLSIEDDLKALTP